MASQQGKPFDREVWTDDEMRTLVRLRIKHDDLFKGSKGNSAKGWKTVIKELEKAGITRLNDNKIKRKWHDETKKFKDLMNPSAHHTGFGTEDGNAPVMNMDPELFEMLMSYHELKHTLNPPALLDTSMPSTSQSSAFGEHCYATSKSEYLAGSTTSSIVPPEYICEEIVVPSSENDSSDDDSDCEQVSVKASTSKRCADFYNKKSKKTTKKVKKSNDEWFKEYLQESRKERREEMATLVGVLKDLAPK
ncbi:Trihelix transcription factor GT-4 [Frankliniella fusca]|uniref:Trihelix transcription factor GT-4 n=1 Tax=Frankliniella fusca TaxID=407009 RepID=A0AAE1HFI6_9NEOP|nr:Trihelix transcription factor GT-4 [Frankliniella fusca]